MTATTIQVNGKPVEAEAGEMLITATDRAGVYIPRFCYHEKLSIAANCRMCLVEVENAPKPLPACATPITDGMVVFTQSKLAREAQQGTLEFLLINHPLDCPVCDQGGECPLQDQAMEFGNDDSRFMERKRAVASFDIGPLVATEMTRCIHCTRCVRFGEEVAGVMELGFPGRGEHAWIGTFLNRAVDSEVSGNIIDLCPVGALTSKPYRFAARVWELQSHRGVSPHDCVGANLNLQTLRGRVERVLPADNPQVNECWLADRDRYSYESVNDARRLLTPMIKDHGAWKEATWESALQFATVGLRDALGGDGANHRNGDGAKLGALAGYACSLEEYYLLQKLARALGCNNVDHRLQQCDFRDDDAAASFPASEVPINAFNQLQAALLVGSNLRKEQPLLALRLRAATVHNAAQVSAINPIAYRQNFTLQHSVAAADITAQLAAVAKCVAGVADVTLPKTVTKWLPKKSAHHGAHTGIAKSLCDGGEHAALVLGAAAQQNKNAAVIKQLAKWICESTGARLVQLAPGNSAAAWHAGCIPHRHAGGRAVTDAVFGGGDVATMFAQPRRAYLLLATDPELDGIHARALPALNAAEFVVRINAYQNDAAAEYADVLLPMAAFAEAAGTFVNCEGRSQRANAAAPPQGEARPAWKILRVLGNFLEADGFDFVTLDDVRAEIPPVPPVARFGDWEIPVPDGDSNSDSDGAGHRLRASDSNSDTLHRLLDIPIYRGDAIVRHAPALQRTADNPPPAARMNAETVSRLKLTEDATVSVTASPTVSETDTVTLPVKTDDRVPADCVYIAAGFAETAALGAADRVAIATTSKAR